MKYTRILLTLLLLADTAAAHKDSLITVHSDGSLEGLPKEYEPAHLTWSGSIPALKLRIQTHETVLPKCLATKLSIDRAEIVVHASWYHHRSLLPPYIVVDIIHSKSKHEFFSGYSLLFNLDTGELIDVERSTATDNKQQNEKLDLAILCSGVDTENMVHAIAK